MGLDQTLWNKTMNWQPKTKPACIIRPGPCPKRVDPKLELDSLFRITVDYAGPAERMVDEDGAAIGQRFNGTPDSPLVLAVLSRASLP